MCIRDSPDVVKYANFGDHRLKGFWVAGGQISPSPIDFHRRHYNTLALPCERVIQVTLSLVPAQLRQRQITRSIRWVNSSIYTLFSWTHLQVRRDDGFSRLMAQTTRTRARMFLLGVSSTLFPILGVKSPENHNFWGVNRRFQAKRAKYWKFHVIETTASISTKFCTTIETLKWSTWVVPVDAQEIQDGGQPPCWKKTLNRHISATVRPILMKFGMMTHIGPLQRIDR